MKTLITACILFLSSFSLFAEPTDLSETGHCLAEQLTASIWAGGTGEHWTFTSDGALLLFDQKTQKLENGSWALTSNQGLMLEVIAGATVRHYRIAPHCDQERIVLHEATSGEVILVPVVTDAVKLATLTGDWQKGFASDESFLTFKADGTYILTKVNTDEYQLRTGRWSVVGNTLLLHKTSGELQAYLIKHLQMDELVLSPFNAGREDWYLNKL